jgi:hypothetical protein
MTKHRRRKQVAPAAGHESSRLWLVQGALALTLFCLLTGLWAYLWISFSF